MDEVVKSQNTNSNTFLSSFTKPLERVKEEERKEKARRKEKPADNPAHVQHNIHSEIYKQCRIGEGAEEFDDAWRGQDNEHDEPIPQDASVRLIYI